MIRALINYQTYVDLLYLQDEINFDLENCLDYVKSGIEAIIEDDVTSRFEAEELKSWNMLTRTNRHYEFISWKITLIWVVGFAVRYFILMPLRVFVCFIGVRIFFHLFNLLNTCILIPFIPLQVVKKRIGSKADFKVSSTFQSTYIIVFANLKKYMINLREIESFWLKPMFVRSLTSSS